MLMLQKKKCLEVNEINNPEINKMNNLRIWKREVTNIKKRQGTPGNGPLSNETGHQNIPAETENTKCAPGKG